MADLCTDGRFELIKKYRQELIDSTNIEMSQDEMAVIDSVLFRFWQMGWLDRLEQPERKKGKWMTSYLEHESVGIRPKLLYCSECCQCIAYSTNFCPNCGADMRKSK